MIPVSLKIKGLYSYQQEQVILFDRLLEAQLFGIFGAVGSGKSSVLEAIAFALYGDTERLNRTDSRTYNMMNLKSDDLLIDFVFKNYDGKQYRFVVQGKRNRKNFDDVKTFARSAYLWQEEHWLPLSHTTAEGILGLSYENFRRTIIIPQGKFQEFLQLSDKARTDMLREIFQLDRFEFFQQTASLERKNNEALSHLKGRMLTYEAVDEHVLEARKENLASLYLMLERLRHDLQRQEAEAAAQQLLKQLYQDVEQVKAVHALLLGKQEKYEALERRLAHYEYAERHFKANLLRATELQGEVAKRQEELFSYKQGLKACDTRLMELLQDVAQAEEAYLKLDHLKQRQSDLECALRIEEGEIHMRALQGRVAKGQSVIEDIKHRQQQLKEELAALQTDIQQRQDKMPDIQGLSDLQAWYDKREFLEENRNQQALECQSLTEKISHSASVYQQVLKEAKLSDTEDFATQILALWEEREMVSKGLRESILHDQLQMRLSDFARNLQEGEACPLCGSLTHPHVQEEAGLLDELRRKEERLQAIEQDQDLLRQLEQKLSTLWRERQGLEEQERLWRDRLQQANAKLEAHLAAFRWQGHLPDEVGVVQETLKLSHVLKQEITALEALKKGKETNFSQIEQDRERYDKRLYELIAAQGAKEGELAALKGQMKTISLETIHNGDTDLELALQNTAERIAQVIGQYDQLQPLLEQQKHLKTTLTERISAADANLKAENERMEVVQKQLQTALAESHFTRLDEVENLLGQPMAVQDVRSQLESFKQQMFSSREKLLALEQQIAGKEFDEPAFALLLEQLKLLGQRVEAQNNQYVAERAEYERQKAMLDEKKGLLQQLEALEARAANLNVLKNLFKGSGFVAYISSVYLQQLCHAANQRFHRLTRQQLQLEVTDKNEFQVRDFLNDGRVRLAKTLSGGQTFQASLSLALALAESVQQQNRAAQNFFFLDEGFGSLDRESLAVAFETLKSLRKENRIVGIISHVEELQQEIDVYLNVINDPEKGSQVKGNWE